MLVLIGGFVALIVIAVNHMSQNLAAASLSVAFLGFTLIPTSGALEWLPSSKTPPKPAKTLSLIGAGFIVVADAYWVYTALTSLVFPIVWNRFISTGATLSFLGLFAYFVVEVVRARRKSIL